MTNTEKVLTWVLSQEGNHAGQYGFNTEWCALFVERALRLNGYTELKGASVYSCTAQMNHWKSKGIWNDGITGIDKNCIVYFDWDMSGDCDHVGIVTGKKGNILNTVEGNTDGATWDKTSVNIMSRSVFRYIRGYVRLTDIFNETVKDIPVNYYGKKYINKDNVGKCQLIQHMLNVTNNASLEEDGIIGDNTDTAIKDFQKKYGLEIDGVVGDETLFKLAQLYFNIPLENFKIG